MKNCYILSAMLPGYASLRQCLARLAAIDVVPAAAAALDAGADGAAAALRDAVLADVPAFSSSGNPEVVPGIERHAAEHIAEIRRLIAGETVGDFAFVRAHAHRRAEQRFPLDGTLHAYRCGHRVLSRWLRDAALATRPGNLEQAVSAIADFAIEYTDIVSAIAAAEYVAQTRLIAEAEGDRRTELLNVLLSGYDESDGRIARLLRRAGYLEQRQAYCVAVCQSVNAAEMENPARAQRIASAITEAMAATPIRTLVGIRDNLVVAVLAAKRRLSGWTAPQSNLSARAKPVLDGLGPAVLTGISADHPSTAFVPKALHEAAIALDFASVATRVVEFASLPIRDLLVHHGADYVQAALPAWAAALIEADRNADGALTGTLRAIADADLNMQKAARLIGRHPNTVYMRLEKIRDITGLDGQRYADLTELLFAVDCSTGSRQ